LLLKQKKGKRRALKFDAGEETVMDYQLYPKPKADKTASRSATKVGGPSGGGQHSISGTMGKHQKTGTGAGGAKGNKGSY